MKIASKFLCCPDSYAENSNFSPQFIVKTECNENQYFLRKPVLFWGWGGGFLFETKFRLVQPLEVFPNSRKFLFHSIFFRGISGYCGWMVRISEKQRFSRFHLRKFLSENFPYCIFDSSNRFSGILFEWKAPFLGYSYEDLNFLVTTHCRFFFWQNGEN